MIVEAAGRRSVLVTGASTGIGRRVVELIAGEFVVYAGVRSERDRLVLSALDDVEGILLDVTRADSIARAVTDVEGRGGLFGLVNNAGVYGESAVADMSDAEYDLVMSVNTRGVYAVTRAFLPAIVAVAGRVVTVGSVTGYFAGARSSAYAMSKHALEAFTDALAAETVDEGVGVSLVEPGTYRSAILDTAVRRGAMDADKATSDMNGRDDPDDVATAIRDALVAEAPRRRYLVVPDRSQAEAVVRGQLARLAQVTTGHPHGVGRAELHAILDAELDRVGD
jgi:NAD(P)-dependent dehydrogenase (short-subunit alcohol dehydrogenase family)